MLAQNFKKSSDLGITDAEFAALAAVLGMLERGDVRHVEKPQTIDFLKGSTIAPPAAFSIWSYYGESDCGTVCCICGWAEFIGRFPVGGLWSTARNNPGLDELFDPSISNIDRITLAQAAVALRSYLSTGHACWEDALH